MSTHYARVHISRAGYIIVGIQRVLAASKNDRGKPIVVHEVHQRQSRTGRLPSGAFANVVAQVAAIAPGCEDRPQESRFYMAHEVVADAAPISFGMVTSRPPWPSDIEMSDAPESRARPRNRSFSVRNAMARTPGAIQIASANAESARPSTAYRSPAPERKAMSRPPSSDFSPPSRCALWRAPMTSCR